MTLLAATSWRTNGDLIADVATMGYLNASDHVIDPTYEGGLWWTKFRPKLTSYNRAIDGVDFRDLPHEDGVFEAAAFDPPYCCKGGRRTSGIKEMDSRYGLEDAPATPALLLEMNGAGFRELVRVVMPGGIIVTKSMNYVSSGKLVPALHRYLTMILDTGCELLEELIHVGHAGPQPGNRTRKATARELASGCPERIPTVQRHFRNNYSTLYVVRTPR